MLKVNFVIIQFASDDVFEDFRNWVMLHGAERFYSPVERPDYIRTYVAVDDAAL